MTYTIDMLMDYETLWDQFNYEPPIPDMMRMKMYINKQYWQIPWSEEELYQYEKESIVGYYNYVNNTQIDPDDVKEYNQVDGITYTFSV